ncbi:41544_t:CDS:2, partial [Gigaspora margarita]
NLDIFEILTIGICFQRKKKRQENAKPYFELIEGEPSRKLENRFEKFCTKWLKRKFVAWVLKLFGQEYVLIEVDDYETKTYIYQFSRSGDGGRDIIMGIYGYAIVIQLEMTINVGDFDFGVLVGAEASRIQRSAYRAADLSKQAIIIATYNNV